MHALRQPGERDGANQQTEVAQRDVVETGSGDQVENDPGQPGRDLRADRLIVLAVAAEQRGDRRWAAANTWVVAAAAVLAVLIAEPIRAASAAAVDTNCGATLTNDIEILLTATMLRCGRPTACYRRGG
ncbi:Uncharacterised protein [Mycobacterium tuberculosis]|nr:Uncharacterised protein [Mycobacterium tuberculosis]